MPSRVALALTGMVAGLALVGCGGGTKSTNSLAAPVTSARASAPTTAASSAAPAAPPGIAQQCVAVEGLLTNATAIIGGGGELSSADDLLKRFDSYGAQLTTAAAGGPATLRASVQSFVAALNTYATDAQRGTPPPANLLGDAATALSKACLPAG